VGRCILRGASMWRGLESEDPQVLTFSLVTREIGLHAARFEVMRRYRGAPGKILHD
jgi:hypothetical protein